MARPRKPFVHQGWFYSKINGVRTKLVPVDDGETAAMEKVNELLKISSEKKKQLILEDGSPLTVREAAGLFMQAKESEGVEAGTVSFYKDQLRPFVKSFGSMPIANLRLAHGEKYRAELFESGIGQTTIAHRLRAAFAVIGYCVAHEYIAKNEWRKLKRPKEKMRLRTLTDSEFEQLLVAARGKKHEKTKSFQIGNRDVFVLKILRFTALRPNELWKLTWDMVKWDANLIVIPANKHKTSKTSKEPRPRIVPILDEAISELRLMQEKRGDSPFVITNRKGKQTYKHSLSQWFYKLVKRANLDGPHDSGEKLVMYHIRHTRLTEAAVVENWSLFNLMEMAGHNNPNTTKRYVHAQAEDLIRAAKEGEARRKAR